MDYRNSWLYKVYSLIYLNGTEEVLNRTHAELSNYMIFLRRFYANFMVVKIESAIIQLPVSRILFYLTRNRTKSTPSSIQYVYGANVCDTFCHIYVVYFRLHSA